MVGPVSAPITVALAATEDPTDPVLKAPDSDPDLKAPVSDRPLKTPKADAAADATSGLKTIKTEPESHSE